MENIDFDKILVLIFAVITLVQFLATRKMITSDDVKEILDKIKPEVDKTENTLDDRLVEIAEKLAELLNKPENKV